MGSRVRGEQYEEHRPLLVPSYKKGERDMKPWYNQPYAGCVMLAVLSIVGLTCIGLPSFEVGGQGEKGRIACSAAAHLT